MPIPPDDGSLQKILTELAEQKKVIAQLQGTKPDRIFGSKAHRRTMFIIAAITLAIGGLGAYQYYRVLQSVIDQYPH